MMKHVTSLLVFCVLILITSYASAADSNLVENGRSRAEIVIAAKPPRTTRLAAQELQTYVQKISGAKLSIVTEPSDDVPISVFVGRSSHTDKLSITGEGLKHGAHRIVSGDDWLVLIGDDTDFTPIEPWPRNNNDIASGKMQRAWNEITGEHWGYTHSQLHKHYSGSNTLFGTPNEQIVDKDGNVNVWTYDERGSFNAVCGFLRSLGVRWYIPGEVGEIVPRADTIALPQIDQTVQPDFPMRILNFRASVYGRDVAMWGYRLGVRQPYGRQAAHGLDRMTHNEHTLTNHADWFALYGGKRQTQLGQRLNQLCYSNEELLGEAVRFARAQFDHFDMDVVSIMPPDGYTAICQCEVCEGKDTPQRGNRGALSDYVWEFVNRVAKEVRKTHPDKLISNCAYGTYTLPPENIDKLEPNVQVIIVGGRRPTSDARDELRQLRKDWIAKTDNPIEVFENYPFTGRGFYLPAYIPRVMGESISETRDVSRGEDIWLTMDFRENAVGYNHFLIYFTARMYWGGKEQNAVKLFDEYCRLFYGPAAAEMRMFFKYCEDHWREMEKDGTKANHALELFAVARSKAAEESVYGQRIKLIDNYLNGLRNKSVQLAQKRGPVPRLRLVSGSRGNVVVDGILDDEPWRTCPVASTGQMRELQTGRQPTYGTSIKTAWIGNNLYFAVRCEEHPAEKPNIATTRNGDQAIWYGDVVEILLETESHSYYQIGVNPAGAIIDLDRGADRSKWFGWSSQAEVATHVADDHWTVEIRIPVVQDENDPLHQVIGRKPTQSLPWHINVCRQRIRENGSEYSAFSPTGAAGFHKKMKFAHFYAGLSHQFPADPTVTDFLIAQKASQQLLLQRKYREALASFVALAAGKHTDLQKSAALEHAAFCARSLDDYEGADKLAGDIPLASVAKTVRMENLLAQRKFDTLIKQFGADDLIGWPFWQIGAGAFARARAYVFTKAGREAEADLKTALTYTVDTRIRTSILATMGSNRETNLGDDEGALKAYRQNYESKERIGAADEFRSVHNAARILARQGKLDESLKTLDRVDVENLRGYWRHATLLVLGETLAAAGRKADALAAYQKVLADKDTRDTLRTAAEKAIDQLNR
jgi:predicted negative regulator of RcsB-dependent stress response